MSQVREPGFDRVVALVLRVGAFGCFFIMLAGLLIGVFIPGHIPQEIERAGVLLMLATPVVRVLVAGILFLREHAFDVFDGVGSSGVNRFQNEKYRFVCASVQRAFQGADRRRNCRVHI